MTADDNPYRTPEGALAEVPSSDGWPHVLMTAFCRQGALGATGWMAFSLAAICLQPDREPPWGIGALGAGVFLASNLLYLGAGQSVVRRVAVTLAMFVAAYAMASV